MNTDIKPDRRAAYQRLLCFAFEDIAARCRQSPQDVACIGAISEWQYKLAAHSAHDFARFNEDWFWLEHQSLLRNFPRRGIEEYRLNFELRKAELAVC